MDWREVTIYTTTAGIEPVESLLEDNGVEGYVLEDAADFEEFLKDTEIYWDYVDEGTGARKARAGDLPEESTCRTATRARSSTRASARRWKTLRRATRSTHGAVCVPRPR